MSRVSAAVLALASALTGYALAGTRVSAGIDNTQGRGLPNGVYQGDHVTLTFMAGAVGHDPSQVECTITAIAGAWVRCGTGDSFSDKHEQVWYDTSHVVVLKKPEK